MNPRKSILYLWPYIVILLLLAAGFIVSLSSLLSIGKQTAAIYDGASLIKKAANKTEAGFEGIQKSIFRAITHGSQEIIAEETANIKENAAFIQGQIALIKENPLGDADTISKLENYLSELAPMQEQVLNLAVRQRSPEAVEYMENSYIPAMKKVQQELSRLIQSADAKETELLVSLQRTQRSAVVLLISLGAAGVLFSTGIGIYMRRLRKRGKKNLFHSVQITQQ